LKICACLGLLSPEQARRLKECGVDRVNHNLNTSEEFYGQICSTHTYADRVNTLRAVVTEADRGAFVVIGQGHQASGGLVRAAGERPREDRDGGKVSGEW